MKTLFFVLCTLLLVTGSSCRRAKTAVLKGRLLSSCVDGQPMANEKVYFRIGKFGGYTDAIAETTTDANGYFTVSYTTRSRYSLTMSAAGGKIMLNIPSRKNIDFGDVYASMESRAVIKVKVNNAYASASDMLIVNSGQAAPFQMPTPFHDTVFPVMQLVNNEPYRNYNLLDQLDQRSYTAHWSFANGLFPQQQITQELNQCTAVPDTVLITID